MQPAKGSNTTSIWYAFRAQQQPVAANEWGKIHILCSLFGKMYCSYDSAHLSGSGHCYAASASVVNTCTAVAQNSNTACLAIQCIVDKLQLMSILWILVLLIDCSMICVLINGPRDHGGQKTTTQECLVLYLVSDSARQTTGASWSLFFSAAYCCLLCRSNQLICHQSCWSMLQSND